MGVPVAKSPLDLWIFQEIISQTRPNLIIETGTHVGGSALFFASVLDLLGGDGHVISVDIKRSDDLPKHDRVSYLMGSSVSPEIVRALTLKSANSDRVMVVLDSDHSEDHVYCELTQLGHLVSPGCYLVVEDTIVNGNPVLHEFGPGPREAVTRFLNEQSEFRVDPSREKYMITFNAGGYLLRESPDAVVRELPDA